MNEKKEPIQRIAPVEITDELRESYLDYAMSVIVSRALPDVRDGLKPVQRRILWSMWETGLNHTAKFRKSANVVGGVMAHYHPHGDSSIYDAMARMAQDFSLRYPLVHGQGNWGSVDGDQPAAMRYTEAKLAKISEHLLLDIEKETVDWKPNYDNSKNEPAFLPAKLPNLLLNGTMGIAVGMATSIPPHNLIEVADGIIYLSEHPDADIKDLMKFVSGPDFPTGGIIYDKKSLEEAYATGKGSITTRGVAQIEEKKNDTFQIVVTEIPYMVNKSDLITKIADLVQNKKIEGIKDLRDESDREGLRIAIDLKQAVPPQKILNQLYKYTELQKNFHFNVLALVDGIQPQILSLKDVLLAYLDHRKLVVRRRTEFDLKKAEERAHILEGLVKALDVIDKVIAVIKKSKDKESANMNLVKIFKLTPIQAQAILEMRLQSLAALERTKIEEELKEKRKIIKELQGILKSPKKILEIITSELEEIKRLFPEGRRTKIVASSLEEFKDEDLIPKEEAIITLSKDGYIKRMPPTNFKAQKRGGKGIIGFDLKEEDFIDQFLAGNTHDNVLFFTDKGRVFQTKIYEIPVSSRTAKGKLIHNYLDIPTNDAISAIVSYPDEEKEERFLVMVTEKGVVKKTPISDFKNVRRNGILAITLKNNDVLKWVKLSSKGDEYIISTYQGQSIRFKEKDVRSMGRTASGVSAMRLKKSDKISGFDVITKDAGKQTKILTILENGYAKQTPIKEYKTQKRGGSGIRTAKVTEKTGGVIATHIVDEEYEEIIALSKKGQMLRTKLADIRTAGRATQGVKIMNLDKGDGLTGIACF